MSLRKRHSPLKVVVIATILCGLEVCPALAGLVIDATVMYPSGGQTVRFEGRILIEGCHMKFVPSSPGAAREFLYVAGTGESAIVDHAARTYYMVSPGAISTMGKTANTAKRFRSRLAELFGMGKSQDLRLSVWSTDETLRISGLSCRRYVIYAGEAMVQDVWATRWDEAGISPHDFVAFRDFLKTYEHSFPALVALVGCEVPEVTPFSGILQIVGYPVFIRQYTEGHPRHAVLLSKPRNIRTIPEEFIPPAGYMRRL